MLDGLLNALTGVLDIRDAFEQVSKLVQRVLPHDLMGVIEINERGDRVRLYAGAGSWACLVHRRKAGTSDATKH